MVEVLKTSNEVGSFRDKKFREALARRANLTRFTLFAKEELDLSGAGVEVEMFRKEYADLLFNAPGDTLYLDIHGQMANNANNKQVHIRIMDDAGGTLALFSSQVYAAGAFFRLQSNITLTSDKKLSISSSMVSDLAARYSDADFAIAIPTYTTRKVILILSGTGGAASDVILYTTRAEFAPGNLE